MNVLFRISGGVARNTELGMGHIYRALNLANSLKQHKVFFLLEDFGDARKIIERKGWKNIICIKRGIDWFHDYKATTDIIENKKIDIVIVDKFGPKLSMRYLRLIKNKNKLVLITDLENYEYPVDLVINGYIGFKNTVTYNKHGAKCLLGTKYQILDISFSKKKNKGKDKFSLLATFGGFDEHNLVETFCYSLSNHINKLRTKIILGPATKKSKKIKELEKKHPKNLTITSSTNDMSKEISQSTFGICSGGITSYEFASFKKPFAIICQYSHQIKTAQEWEKKGFAFNLGFPNKNISKRIQKFLKMIIEKNVRYSPMNILLDGQGTKRVALEIIKLLQKN